MKMECEEEEEDTNSLLSLSQTFLQPDSSSASMGLSTNQLHSWSALTSAATDVAGQFSPISPVDGYSTNINTGHALADNEANVRIYGIRSSTGQSSARSSVSTMFNRPVNSCASVSISSNYTPGAKVSGKDFKHAAGHMHLNTSTDLCYDQTCGSRSSTNLYGDKDTGYSSCGGLSVSSSSLHVNASNGIAASFAHTEYSDDHMLSLTSASDHNGKLGSRNLQLDQKNFESRCKQQDYGKDFSNLYEQSAEKHQNTEINMPFDRRDPNAFESSFEFSSDSRDFMSSARLDVTSVTRGAQDQNCHDTQKYTPSQLGDSNVLSSSLSLDSKRVVSSCMSFGITGHVEDAYGRLSTSQKKSLFPHQLSDLPSDLDPVFHGYQSDFGGHQKISLDSHRNFVSNEFQGNDDTGRFDLKDQVNFKNSNSKWTGRPRAHRKMARLLGSDDHRNYLQTAEANNSHKSSFSKPVSPLEPASQDKSSYQQNIQKNLTSSRTFLTVEEELDLRTNHHQQRNFISKRQENDNRQHMAQREFGLLHNSSTFLFDSNTIASSMHKDSTSNMLASQQFLPSAPLDLDFHSSLSVSQSQKDLDLNQHFGLQVSKDFALDGSHPVQDDFSFDPSGDAPHVNQAELSLPDNLGIVSHVQPELSFEAYFNSTSDRDFASTSDRDFSAASDRDLNFCRKFSASTTRDINYAPNASVNDFNIEDYMNPQTQRDLSQSYFERPDMPQDMTVYQKTPMDKSIPETLTSFKGRDKGQSLTSKEKQGEISELQKELTKTSTKESLKGIRIPRDINRAMEILQGLQEDEREEERRKELQQRQQYQQQQQMQGLVSSPKKTFQSKHNIENSSLTDQQLLGSSGNFMVDHSVGSFLDHSHFSVQEQPPDGLQIVQSYQPLTQMHQPVEVEMGSTLSTKHDLQQNLAQHMTSELGYNIFKRLACSSLKNTTQGSCFSSNSNNLASILDENHTSDPEMQFQVTGLHYQTQQSELDDVVSNGILNGSGQTTLELSRTKNEVTFIDFEQQQPQHTVCEKMQTPVVEDDAIIHSSVELGQDIYAKQDTEVLLSSRNSLFDMMKREEFCDAIISTSKQTIKVHQVVLCSMSQYLTTLLQQMKSAQLPSYTTPAATSSANLTSQIINNESVLLLINCDGIKSSSMMAFLVYIYLGRAELSQSNIVDMYILACSLRVQTLKDICTEFMWQAAIPGDKIQVPQLIVTVLRIETQDQIVNTEMSTEDKCTNTSYGTRRMEAATQTDKSTSKAGEGSQEEWVMLKKTKQKTVSPSKSRILGKSLTVTDSPGSCKSGKKGWLSPKRRYKTENQIEGKITEKEVVISGKELTNTFPSLLIGSDNASVKQLDIPQNMFSCSNISDVKTKDNKHELVSHDAGTSESKLVCEKSAFCVSKQPLILKKTTRTTVEIAAAAAAAKLAVHSYCTRTARGTMKTPVSYALLASGLEKKKPVVNIKEKTISTMSKKKDFIKSNPQTDFSHHTETDSVNESDSLTVLLENNFNITGTNTSSLFEPQSGKSSCLSSQAGAEYLSTSSEPLKANSSAIKSSVKRPFKKSIVHRSRSEEVLNNNCVQLASNLSSRTDVHANNESDFMDSYLIDSFVNTMECDNTDVDLQKVINDLDTLTKSPLLTTASSSLSSTSITSPLKSPTALVTTPDFTSPLKSRSTPQGFRKRLIHQINSEKNGCSSFVNIHSENTLPNTSSTSPDNTTLVSTSDTCNMLSSISTTTTLSLVSAPAPLATSVISSSEEACQSVSNDKLLAGNKDIIQSSSITNSEPASDQVATTYTDAVDELTLSFYSLQEETDLMLGSKASSFSSMTDLELGLKDDSGAQFLHKLFKRKRKAKARKPFAADNESTSVKPKLKKLQMSESEGSVIKPRPRKAAGSDTEGSGSRSKQKKNVFSENEGALGKVRPPPKKRAKMELELLRAEEPDKHRDNLKMEAEEINGRETEIKDVSITDTKSDTSSESVDIQEETLKLEMKKTPGEGMKKRSPKITKAEDEVIPLSELEVTMETKMTLMLEELAKTMNLKTRQFSCKLCHTKMRSARRAVRHMKSHSVNLEDAVENIAVGEKEGDQEACDICGYRTKDRSYHYMHIHKYFKHGVSLPMGWSTDKCEICGKECFTKFQLKEHMMSHDDSHSFVCWHCNQSFKMRNSLNSHVFHKHSDVRKHHCKACTKTFKTWTQLKVHVRSHTGERPFACIDCEHRSTTQGNMKLHLSTHGYSKEKIQQAMEKICKNVPEMDPVALEQVMINIAEKVQAEQMTVKEKKNKKNLGKLKPNTGDHVKVVSNSPTKTSEDSSRKKSPNSVKQQDTAIGSKFAGSQIKRLLTQPLSQMKPPKFILPQLPQSADCGSNSNEESGQSQVLCDSSDPSLNTFSLLLQTQNQKQDTNGLYGETTFLITLPYSEQQQQQQQQTQAVDSVSSMMAYTLIPTYILPNQTRPEALIDPSTGLALSMFSASDILSSGLNMLQPGVQLVELVQSNSIYADSASSSIVQCPQEPEAAQLLGAPQGREMQQDIAVGSLQYPDSKVVVLDSSQREIKHNLCPSLPGNNSNSPSCSTAMVVLPTATSSPQKSQPLHQQTEDVFNYSPLISSSQAMLLPVIIPSGLDTSNFVNFSVTTSSPEDGAALNTSDPHFEDVTAETKHMNTPEPHFEDVTVETKHLLTEPQGHVAATMVTVDTVTSGGRCDNLN